MDSDRVKTFLEIIHSRSFVAAAQRLNVTQTTVSARIKTLEEELGRRLFVRNRSGAHLTPAGEEFRKYAQTLVQVWEQARHQVSLPPGREAVVALGGELSLWNPLLLEWMVLMRERQSNVAIRAHVALPEQLMSQLRMGLVDLAVMYAPRIEPGLTIDLLLEEQLVLVKTTDKVGGGSSEEFIYVDWGPQFSEQQFLGQARAYDPSLFVGLGPLGLAYMLRVGGHGYFRKSVAAPYIRQGYLEMVPDAAEITYPAYVVYTEATDQTHIGPCLNALREVARSVEVSAF